MFVALFIVVCLMVAVVNLTFAVTVVVVGEIKERGRRWFR
jgi:hypothetical protein